MTTMLSSLLQKLSRRDMPMFLIFIALFSINIMAQVAPGPYEILPFEDAYIVEAWMDLLAADTQRIADWSGMLTTSWESPNAYNGHRGTDFSLDTGTPLYAPANGQVVTVVTNIPEDDHSTGFGNYVKIQITSGSSPEGENLDVILAHQLPQVQVSVGQNVVTGQLIGYADNTGNSTSEHLHFESRIRNASSGICPFYYGHWKYPIMFNPTGTKQVGHIIKITAPSTPIRSDRFDTSQQIATAHQNQLYFSSYWKRGYYRVFIPNDANNRSGWIRATDADEVYTGTVIQAMPDPGTYVHTATLQNPYSIKALPDNDSATLGQIVYGGGRFVADQIENGWYRIPLPAENPTWGWVKPDTRMIVYPQLYNPAINLAQLPNNDFPLQESFSTVGKSMFGRPKYNRSFVREFNPPAPGGDGKALFITDAINHGNGKEECVSVGKVNHRNYYVQCAVYFNYRPEYMGSGEYERYGIFARDDGFASMDQTFEGKGNCYALLYDSDDGRLRAAKIVNASITDFLSTPRYITTDGWNILRIECEDNHIRYYLNGNLLVDVIDTTFPCGPCGMGYVSHTTSYPSARGAYFDNFIADVLPTPVPTTTPTPAPSPTPMPSPSPTSSPTPAPSPSPNITPSPTPPLTPPLHFTFDNGEEGWQFADEIPPFDMPFRTTLPGRLGLSPAGSTYCFSYWYSPIIHLKKTAVYRVVWEISSSLSNPDNVVQFRLRINQQGAWSAWDRVVNSNLQNTPSAGMPVFYKTYISPEINSEEDNKLILSFDIMSFDSNDDSSSWVYLESVSIEEAEFLKSNK